MESELGLTCDSPIADIGSGTGLLARIFLENGNLVWCVEPNQAMREAGEAELAAYPGFRSVEACAEQTMLAPASVDFVTAGQAFHWFDPVKCRGEFSRILSPNGYVVLIWNARRLQTAINRAYEEFLERYALEYGTVSRKGVGDSQIRALYGEGGWKQADFDNPHRLDYVGLTARVLSSSYMPLLGASNFEEMMADLRALFERYAVDGYMVFEQDAQVYYGRL